MLKFCTGDQFKLTPASAASTARWRCTSGGTRTMNLLLYLRDDKGKGSSSLLLLNSAIQSLTTEQMPFNAFSEVVASQLRLGNSAHKP